MSEEKMELKPCPFCGSPATTHEDSDRDWEVYCDGPSDCAGDASSRFPTEAQAIAAWNRRPPSPVGRDLGSPQAGLGGLGETPSDALEAARRIVDEYESGDSLIVARALLAASPSPWRDMEEDEMARAENARRSPAAAPTASMVERSAVIRECAEAMLVEHRRSLDEAKRYKAEGDDDGSYGVCLSEALTWHDASMLLCRLANKAEGLNAGPPSEASTTPSPPLEGGGE